MSKDRVQAYDPYTSSTQQNDFTRNVGRLLEQPISSPRIGEVPYEMPVVYVNYRNHEGSYPIGHVSKGTKLTEFGTLDDGRILVCFSTNGLPPEPYCANGNAFPLNKEYEGEVFKGK